MKQVIFVRQAIIKYQNKCLDCGFLWSNELCHGKRNRKMVHTYLLQKIVLALVKYYDERCCF